MDHKITLALLLVGTLLFPTVVGSEQGPAAGSVRTLSDGTLPKDVYADSRSRLPAIKREDLNEQGKKAYDAAAAGSPAGRPEGVAAIRLHRSGVDVRWDSPVGRRLTELTIITTAR